MNFTLWLKATVKRVYDIDVAGEELDALYAEADLDGDGSMDHPEFCKVMYDLGIQLYV